MMFEKMEDCLADEMMNAEFIDKEQLKKVCSIMMKDKEDKMMGHDNKKYRELRAELNTKIFFDGDGGISITAKLLASGTWTDSNVGTPLFYSEKALETYAKNWMDTSLWSRHSGGTPRSITDKIGEIKNPRFENGAVFGDLWLHGKTQTSRDTIELIKNNLVKAVSVEHGGKERWNTTNKRYEIEEIIFLGCAVVNRGACSTCKIENEINTKEDNKNMTNEKELAQDIQSLQIQLEEQKKAKATQSIAEFEATKLKIIELENQNKELMQKITNMEHEYRVKELQKQIAELNKEPVYHTKITTRVNGISTIKELELDNSEYPLYSAKDFGE